MAKLEGINVQVREYWALFLFPVAKYVRCGDVALLTVFGLPVYRRAGKASKILWFGTRMSESNEPA